MTNLCWAKQELRWEGRGCRQQWAGSCARAARAVEGRGVCLQRQVEMLFLLSCACPRASQGHDELPSVGNFHAMELLPGL